MLKACDIFEAEEREQAPAQNRHLHDQVLKIRSRADDALEGNDDRPEEEEDLWVIYKRDPTNTALRNALIERYLPIVKYHGKRIGAHLPNTFELDDLLSAGVLGLMDAIDGFDLSRGIKFETYCVPRVRGAMLDELRTMDWVPRLVRSKERKLKVAINKLKISLGRQPEAHELAAEMGLSLSDLKKMMIDASAVDVISLSKKWFETDSYKDVREIDILADKKAEDPTRSQHRLDVLRVLTKGCSREERLILIMYYWEELTMKEIGETLDISESRVSQMHSALMERLHKMPAVAREFGIEDATVLPQQQEQKLRSIAPLRITEDDLREDVSMEDILERSIKMMGECILSFSSDASNEAKRDFSRYQLQKRVLKNIRSNLPLFAQGEDMSLRVNQLQALAAYIRFLGDPNQEGIGYFRQPTGAGKTGLFGVITRLAGVRTLILVPTTNLLEQTKQDFTDLVKISAEDIGIIGGGKVETGKMITIGTYQSHLSRMKSDPDYREHVRSCDLVICDEAHKSLGSATQRSIEQMEELLDEEVTDQEEQTQQIVLSDVEKYTSKTALRLGFTATPTLAAKSVEAMYKNLIADASLSELVRAGILKKYKVMQVEAHVHTGEIEQRIDHTKEAQLLERENLYEALLTSYRQAMAQVPDRLLGFATCSSIAECDRFAATAETLGLRCVIVTSREYETHTKSDPKKDAEQALLKGETDIIVSVDKLKEGWNFPPLNAVILARATLSPANILQPAGRASRAFGDQKYAYIFEAKWSSATDDGSPYHGDSNTGLKGKGTNGKARHSLSYKKPLTLADAIYLSGEDDVHGVCEGWEGERLKFKCLNRLDAKGEVVINDVTCIGLNRYVYENGMNISSLTHAVKDAGLEPIGQAQSLGGWIVDVFEKEEIENLPFVRRWREKPSETLDENGDVMLQDKQGIGLNRYADLHGMDVGQLQEVVRAAGLTILGKAQAGGYSVEVYRREEIENLPYVQRVWQRIGDLLDDTGEIEVDGVAAIGTNRFASANGIDTQLLKDAVEDAGIPVIGTIRSGARTVQLYSKSSVLALPYVQKSMRKNGYPVLDDQGEVTMQETPAIAPNKFADVHGLVAKTLQKSIEAAGLIPLGQAKSGARVTDVYDKTQVMQLPYVQQRLDK